MLTAIDICIMTDYHLNLHRVKLVVLEAESKRNIQLEMQLIAQGQFYWYP